MENLKRKMSHLPEWIWMEIYDKSFLSTKQKKVAATVAFLFCGRQISNFAIFDNFFVRMVAATSTMIAVGSLKKFVRSLTQDVSAATRDRMDLRTRGWRWKRCSPKRAETQWECHGMPRKLAKSKGTFLFCWQQLLKEVKFWKQTSLRKQLNSEFVVFAQLVIPQFRMFSRRKSLYDFNRWMSISMPHRGGWFGRAVLTVLVPTDLWVCFFQQVVCLTPKNIQLDITFFEGLSPRICLQDVWREDKSNINPIKQVSRAKSIYLSELNYSELK